MAVAEFLEDIVSHLPALHLLQHLGFQYLTPTEALATRGGKRSRVVLDTILLEQLGKLNKITFKGQTHDFTEANLRSAVDALIDIPFDGSAQVRLGEVVRLPLEGDLVELLKLFQQDRVQHDPATLAAPVCQRLGGRQVLEAQVLQQVQCRQVRHDVFEELGDGHDANSCC